MRKKNYRGIWLYVGITVFGMILAYLSTVWMGNRISKYRVIGYKDGEKIERVVELTKNYRFGVWRYIYHGERSVAKTITKDGEICHRVYYVNPTHDDVICGFDTICEIKRYK